MIRSARSRATRSAILFSTLALCVACRREPSAEEIDRQLQLHPEILYRVIERHPA
jgi:hypothetical protein